MGDLVKAVFATPIPNLLILVGLLFLVIAVIGKITGKIEPGDTGRIAAGVIGGVLLVTGLIMHGSSSSPAPPAPAKAARILDFAAEPGAVVAGKPVRLCYGVRDASQVRIAPGPGDVKIAEKECLSLTPTERTIYTLTAVGHDGQSVQRQVTVEVTPTPAPVTPPAPSPVSPVPVAPDPTPTPPVARNDVRNFRAVSVSPSELRVSVDYTYAGDQSDEVITIGATPLQSGGNPIPGLITSPGRVTVGQGTATVGLRMVRATGTYDSTSVRVCMRAGRTTEFACRTFAHGKQWVRAEPAPSPGRRVTLNERDSYHFRTGTRHQIEGGDFYFLEGKFWANNRQQRGVADLGNVPIPLADVDPARVNTRAFQKFGVPAVVGHTYVAQAREGEEGRFITFKVIGSRGPAAVVIEFQYR